VAGSPSAPRFPAGLDSWTVDDLQSTRQRDPVNVIVSGDLVQVRDVLRRVGLDRVGWLERLAAPQWFREGRADWHREDLSVATGRQIAGPGQRLHARLFSPGPGSAQPVIGTYTALTAHLDRFGLCLPPEVAASFTKAREELSRRLEDEDEGHKVTRVRGRARGSVRQCDGTRVVADGRAAIVQ
jgi:hypothetical protein